MKIRNCANALFLSGALACVPLASSAERDTADILIDFLVRKGILTEGEAYAIREEVEAVAAAEREQAATPTAAPAANPPAATPHAFSEAVPMPKALDGIRLYGDARFRFQAEDVDDAATRERWRYRARFGADYHFAESPFSLGARLETGSGNDSTNANFGGFFDKTGDEMRLGLIYLNYAGEDLSVSLGKHKHPFKISSAFWDSDINPEGVSESFRAGPVRFNLGQYVIDEEREDRGGSDDFLFVAQAEWSVGEGLTVAPLYLRSTNGTSTVSESAGFAGENAQRDFRHFSVLALPVEYAFKSADGTRQKLFGTFGLNLDADDAVREADGPFFSPAPTGDEDLFYNFGYQYGSAKSAGTWQAGLEYRYLEGASYTPNLSDSDFGKNSLNHRGFLLSYKYAVTDFFSAGLTYMDSERIDEDFDAPVVAKDKAKILQVDAAVKF